jgi:hypothetical protein
MKDLMKRADLPGCSWKGAGTAVTIKRAYAATTRREPSIACLAVGEYALRRTAVIRIGVFGSLKIDP